MRILFFASFFCVACCLQATAQRRDSVVLGTMTGVIYGTLTTPQGAGMAVPLVIIIPGSGPTDRNGNNQFMTNNSLLLLSDSLTRRGIASLRYDKRGIGASKAAAADESKVRFGDYVQDVTGWIRMYRSDKRFSRLFVAGHSEGSLIGIIAVKQEPVAGLVSIAGTSMPAEDIIMLQLRESGRYTKEMLDTMRHLFTVLKKDGKVAPVPKGFYGALFRPSVQGYMLSWMQYNPLQEIKGLKGQMLIIQGTTDLQVDTPQAYALAAAKPDARLVIIPGMNHIFRTATNEMAMNAGTYNNPDLPLKQELVQAIADFVHNTAARRQ